MPMKILEISDIGHVLFKISRNYAKKKMLICRELTCRAVFESYCTVNIYLLKILVF